jgi:hypothetical protein
MNSVQAKVAFGKAICWHKQQPLDVSCISLPVCCGPVAVVWCILLQQPETETKLLMSSPHCSFSETLQPISGLGRLILTFVYHAHTIVHARTSARTLNLGSARLTGCYLHNTRQKRSSAGFEQTIPAIKRPQTFTLGQTATDRQLAVRNPFVFVCPSVMEQDSFCCKQHL